jgi:hypothetical protein
LRYHWLPVDELLANTTEPPVQNVTGPDAVIVGTAGTATTVIAAEEEFTQPLLLVTVYVIVTTPSEMPATSPLAVTVAIELLLLVQVPAGVVLVRVVVLFRHAVEAPATAATGGNAFTVIPAVLTHPLPLVYVIAAVPGTIAVTTPALFTVATEELEDIHGFIAAAVADPVNVVVNPAQIVSVPVITGNAFTVILTVWAQPLLFVYVITVVPTLTPVTNPALFTKAMEVFVDIHGFTAVAVPDPVKRLVELVHTLNPPIIVGKAFTKTLAVRAHPLSFV